MQWPDRRLLDLFGIEIPIVQAPMATASDPDMAVAVCDAGGLGSLPCGALTPAQIRDQVALVRARTRRPLNLNFFCHVPPPLDNAPEALWRDRLAPYYHELGVDPAVPVTTINRAPFDAAMCAVVEELRPEVVSFHYGAPEEALAARVKAAGCRIISSATTVAEARWLEARGVDAVIAQGYEAGGHRGMFLSEDLSSQIGTFALVPQLADAVKIPIIATGGIADGRGIAAAFALGAAGVQIGTAYLFCPEAKIAALYRDALAHAGETETVITNVLSGRPARSLANRLIREVGPLSNAAPPFPRATAALAPLRAKAEAAGSTDFSPLLAGQSAPLGRPTGAAELTRRLAAQAQECMRALAGQPM
jgi:nitronate monooxygenase